MKFIAPLLALLVFTSSSFAADSDIQKLQQEITVLKLMVMKLTTRVNQLEGRLALQSPPQSNNTLTATRTNSRPVYSKRPTPKPQKIVKYELVKVIPKTRVVGRNSYQIKGLSVIRNLNNRDQLKFKLLYQNRGNDKWVLNREKYILQLDDVDVRGSATFGSTRELAKDERKTRDIVFVIDKKEAIFDARLVIEQVYSNTKAVFKITLKRTEK